MHIVIAIHQAQAFIPACRGHKAASLELQIGIILKHRNVEPALKTVGAAKLSVVAGRCSAGNSEKIHVVAGELRGVYGLETWMKMGMGPNLKSVLERQFPLDPGVGATTLAPLGQEAGKAVEYASVKTEIIWNIIKRKYIYPYSALHLAAVPGG